MGERCRAVPRPARGKEINTFIDRPDDIVVADGGGRPDLDGHVPNVRRPDRTSTRTYSAARRGAPLCERRAAHQSGQKGRLFCGDGSIGFNFMEFETAIRKSSQSLS